MKVGSDKGQIFTTLVDVKLRFGRRSTESQKRHGGKSTTLPNARGLRLLGAEVEGGQYARHKKQHSFVGVTPNVHIAAEFVLPFGIKKNHAVLTQLSAADILLLFKYTLKEVSDASVGLVCALGNSSSSSSSGAPPPGLCAAAPLSGLICVCASLYFPQARRQLGPGWRSGRPSAPRSLPPGG